MTDSRTRALDTRLVHDGEPHIEGAVTMPIFQAVTYLQQDASSYDAIRYSRLNNTPNHTALHQKLASICGAEAALATSSGMAAISTALLGILHEGDHLLAQRSLYGGTFNVVVRELPRFGIEIDLFDSIDEARELVRPETRVLYLETISNPTMEVGHLREGAELAREEELISMVDNTFASPVNCRPLELGFDLVLHSATKYLNGHSDVTAGVIAGKGQLVEVLRGRLNLFGATLDPNACWLLQRGLKTLALRVGRQNENAVALANFLEAHPAVESVSYPGLESHRSHERAKELFDAGFGGMLAFTLADSHAAAAFCDALTLGADAPSLGGVETLVTRPVLSSHKGLTPTELEEAGIGEGMVRVSVGIEAEEDLLADFATALEALP